MTDWLRVFVRPKAILPEARAVTREALSEIARKPNETIAAAAGRLLCAFRVATVDRDLPHVI